MKLRSFSYLIKEGFKGLWYNRLMSIASIMTVSASLIVFSLFLILGMNVEHLIEQVRSEYELLVVIDESADEATIQGIGKAIGAMHEVGEVRLVTKEEGLEDLKATMDNPELLEGLELDNPLRNTYRVSLKNLSKSVEVMEDISLISGVVKINSNQEAVTALQNITKVVNMVGFWLFVLLMVISIAIITNTIRLAVYARRKEINVMKFIGATNWFIRWPFMVEGIVIGLIAAALSFGIVYGGYYYVSVSFQDLVGGGLADLKLIETWTIMQWVAISVVVLGVFSGMTGSVISVRKHMKV
ncbi:MAG: ABC transporter permease [Ruminococcaceae bacterium]|nr:ABC transporter permease [Oscillospiraceae bacterium]